MTLSRWTSFAIAVSVLFASGALAFSYATDSEQLDEAAARVAAVPLVVGSWVGVDDPPDEASFAQAGAKSYWMRTYVHEETKASVQAILMCGRAGKMAVHTPEVCYHGAGYELRDPPLAFAVKGGADDPLDQLWMARFDKRVGRSSQLRLYWGWNARGTWEASATPRWQFRGEPFLYKLYLSCDVPTRSAATPNADAAAEFLPSFVPVLQKTLFPVQKNT